jgi:hypothetical protein
MPLNIDYLQIDLEASYRTTLTVLEKLNSEVMDTFKFATVTFEHDIYSGNYHNTRTLSREIFENRGYVRVFSDVSNGGNAFEEDWYVHPELVDMTNIIKREDSMEWKDIVNFFLIFYLLKINMSKGLFILIGESFRDSQHNGRTRDTEKGVEYQKESTMSHLKLINNLKNYSIDIAINTYETKYKDDLLKWYGSNVVYSNFTTENYQNVLDPVDSFKIVVNNSLKNIFSKVELSLYNFLFICRLDVLLKDPFIEVFNPNIEHITYPNLMSWEKTPCISDLFCIVPSKYYGSFGSWKGLLNNGEIILNPNSLRDLFTHGLTLDDINFISDKLYIANTSQSWNPLYKINSRSEAKEIRYDVRDLVYIKEDNKIIKKLSHS